MQKILKRIVSLTCLITFAVIFEAGIPEVRAATASCLDYSGQFPELVGSVGVPSDPSGIVLNGDVAYVTNYNAGLSVWDVSDPSDPVLVRSVASASGAWSADLDGSLLCVGTWDGVAIYEVSDPFDPVLIGKFETWSPIEDVAWAGDLVFAIQRTKLIVLDVQDPYLPIQIGLVDAGQPSFRAIHVRDGIALVGSYDALFSYDVSDPTQPILVNILEQVGQIMDMVVVGNNLYTAAIAGGGMGECRWMDCGQLSSIDISDPAQPVLLDWLTPDAMDSGALAASGSRIFLSSLGNGISVVDITDPADLRYISHAENRQRDGYSAAIAVKGDVALMASRNPGNLLSYDVSGAGYSDAITIAGHYGFALEAEGSVVHAAVGALNCAPSCETVGAMTYQVSTDGRLEWISNLPGGFPVSELARDGDYLVAANYSQPWLWVFDVTDPAAPAVIDSVSVGHNVTDLAIRDHVVLAAADSAGVYAFRMQSDGSLEPAGHLVPGFPIRFTRFVDGRVFAGSLGNVAMLEVSYSNGMRLLVKSALPSSWFLSAHGDFAYFSSAALDAIVVVDISQPDSIVVESVVPYAELGLDSPKAMEIAEGRAIVADTWQLAVLDLSNPTWPVVGESLPLVSARSLIRAGGHICALTISDESGLIRLVTLPAVCASASSVIDDAPLPFSRPRVWNYPNPFNPSTVISFDLPTESKLDLTVYDLQGRVVRKLVSGAEWGSGRHSVTWRGRDDNGRAVAAGVYLYRLAAGSLVESHRMTLLK